MYRPMVAEYCIELIRAALQEQPVSPIPEGLSLKELFDFSKLHGVEAIVYSALSELEPDAADPLWQSWGQRAEMLLAQSLVQLAERDILLETMEEEGIPLMPVKGCWLKEAYPRVDFRQMSDLDMLIHPEDRDRAGKVMLAMGYTKDEHDSLHHDCYKKEPYLSVELHYTLIGKSIEHYSYYSDVWSRAKSLAGRDRIYRLSAEDEYIFYFIHMKKHMDRGGCGIRALMDFTMYQRAYPHMNTEYLKGEFEKLGISDYVHEIGCLSRCWFESGAPVPSYLNGMAEDILCAGTYGYIENVYRREMEQLKKKYKNPVLLISVYWLKRIFRPLWFMKHLYPILEKYPVLLPFTWVARIMKKCFSSPATLLYHIKQIFKEGTKDA